MAVFWSETLVHGEESHWCCSKKDPERVNEIDLDPESHDDKKDSNVVSSENKSPEAQVREIC